VKIVVLNKIKNLTFFNTKKSELILYVIIGVCAALKGPFLHRDSYAFLEMPLNRSPLYVLFLKLFTTLFGDNYIWPLICVQFLALVFAVHYLLKTIAKQFHLHPVEALVLQFILLSPSIYFNYTSGAVLSEALSYPLVLLVFALAFNAFASLNLRPLLKSVIPLYFLILTRGQFIVFIPVFIALGIYISHQKRSATKKWLPLLVLVLLPIFTNYSERLYNKVMFGNFENNTMNYVHLLTTDFYLSKASTVEIFDDPDEIKYFNIVHASLEKAGLTSQNVKNRNESAIDVFNKEFSEICNQRIHELGLIYFQEKGLNYFEQNRALNELCKGMFFKLIKFNFSERIRFFAKNLKVSYGSAKQLLLFILLMVYALIMVYKTKTAIFKFILLGAVLMLANNVLIAFIIHAIKRYTFYFDWILFATVIVVFNELSKKIRHEN
jgi:hypothetical protein